MHVLSFDTSYDYSRSRAGIEVPIVLKYGDFETRLDAKLDTGAEYCIFNRSYAEELGLELETGHPIQMSTTTGPFKAWGHSVSVVCMGIGFDATVYFAESPEFPRNVLGRAGWLDRFRIEDVPVVVEG